MLRLLLVGLTVLGCAASARAETSRVEFHLNNGLILEGDKGKNDWKRTAHFALIFDDDIARSATMGPGQGGNTGGWGTVNWSGRVDAVDVRKSGDKVSGTIRAYVASNELAAGEYAFTVDGRIQGGKLVGTFTTKHAKGEASGPIVGDAVVANPPTPSADDGLVILVLDKALPKGEVLKIYLDRKDGVIRSAFAFATAFSRRPFDIDASGVTIKDGELAGTFKVLRTVGKLKDRPLVGTYQVKAKLQGGLVRGSHSGNYGEDKGQGNVWGEVLARPALPKDPIQVWAKLEDGLFGGADWQNRAFFNFILESGRANMGKLFNNKGVYRGRLDRAELTLTGDRVRGRMEGTILDGGVTAGSYTFELDGQMVGHFFYGHYTTRLGEQSKQGYFVGGVSPGKK